jgi:hypothetical protein
MELGEPCRRRWRCLHFRRQRRRRRRSSRCYHRLWLRGGSPSPSPNLSRSSRPSPRPSPSLSWRCCSRQSSAWPLHRHRMHSCQLLRGRRPHRAARGRHLRHLQLLVRCHQRSQCHDQHRYAHREVRVIFCRHMCFRCGCSPLAGEACVHSRVPGRRACSSAVCMLQVADLAPQPQQRQSRTPSAGLRANPRQHTPIRIIHPLGRSARSAWRQRWRARRLSCCRPQRRPLPPLSRRAPAPSPAPTPSSAAARAGRPAARRVRRPSRSASVATSRCVHVRTAPTLPRAHARAIVASRPR